MSIRWCFTPSRSCRAGFALAISKPLYIIRESAQTISALRSFASCIDFFVFPDAVGPVITIIGKVFVIVA